MIPSVGSCWSRSRSAARVVANRGRGWVGGPSEARRCDDVVVLAPVTTGSSGTDKQDATFVETAGLANPSCVWFESIDRPGSYLRHQNFQLHLQPNDGSPLFAQDATFCPGPGNSGQGTSLQSVNFPGRYLRTFNNVLFIARNGGANPWDVATDW